MIICEAYQRQILDLRVMSIEFSSLITKFHIGSLIDFTLPTTTLLPAQGQYRTMHGQSTLPKSFVIFNAYLDNKAA